MSPSPTLDWQAAALQQRLARLCPGIYVEVAASLGSTNSSLLDRLREQGPDSLPCLLVAEQQTAGRGRMGREWLASPGSSLTFSIGLSLALQDWSGLSLALGCAIANALEPAGSPPRLQLKWPNDIWLDGRKLGGILIETQACGGERAAVVGVGLNISKLDDKAQDQFSTGFASLSEIEPGVTAPEVLAQLAPALLQALLDFPQSGFAPWQQTFARRDLTQGCQVSAGTLQGVARGVTASGELLLETAAGVMHKVSGGEVSLRLVAGGEA